MQNYKDWLKANGREPSQDSMFDYGLKAAGEILDRLGPESEVVSDSWITIGSLILAIEGVSKVGMSTDTFLEVAAEMKLKMDEAKAVGTVTLH